MSINDTPGPWLRGPIPDVHPLLAPVLYSFEQAREDLDRWTAGLTDAQIWERPPGIHWIGRVSGIPSIRVFPTSSVLPRQRSVIVLHNCTCCNRAFYHIEAFRLLLSVLPTQGSVMESPPSSY
jgi:hypothetical protein